MIVPLSMGRTMFDSRENGVDVGGMPGTRFWHTSWKTRFSEGTRFGAKWASSVLEIVTWIWGPAGNVCATVKPRTDTNRFCAPQASVAAGPGSGQASVARFGVQPQ